MNKQTELFDKIILFVGMLYLKVYKYIKSQTKTIERDLKK